ncbi:membrane protein [Clostridium omnivorum]|uniref:Membrane protein n=2 Tax=Clostridium omnivorum TaxID=1604902 RepID=A0ABQ5NBE3_9CLOT|nr:membrane protein [Clostridium sp. E14]
MLIFYNEYKYIKFSTKKLWGVSGNMNNNEHITKKGLITSIAGYLIFILVYWVAFYELNNLCRFGRLHNNLTVFFGCMIFFLAWFIILLINRIKKRANEPQKSEDSNELYSHYKAISTIITIIAISLITIFYGVKIYHSAINYNGKLSWILGDLKNKKTVKLEQDNIYENGIEGIFTDINKKVAMPEKLYISNSFSINFDSNGKITSFDTYLYGKTSKNVLESFLISYDSKKSRNIIIYLNGHVNADYSDDKLLEPLLKTMKVIPLKKTVSNWPEKQFGIIYYGKRSFGYNSSGIVNIDSKGNTNSDVKAISEIIGYTVSVFVPGKENKYTPVRYNLIDGLDNLNLSEPPKENSDKKISKKTNNSTDEFYLSELIGYRLEVTGAAAGSRAYSLNLTSDGGVTWKTINEDPFSGNIGTAAGVVFLNDKLGFLCLSHSGGSNGQLYRTDDGGVSFKKVDFPSLNVTLANGKTYNPFDLPGMPFEKDGVFSVLIGQGADGDYNGGSKALYQSQDQGKTWNFIKEASQN